MPKTSNIYPDTQAVQVHKLDSKIFGFDHILFSIGLNNLVDATQPAKLGLLPTSFNQVQAARLGLLLHNLTPSAKSNLLNSDYCQPPSAKSERNGPQGYSYDAFAG